MNQLYFQDLINIFKETIILPLRFSQHTCGSDPITHKKVREEINESSANQSSAQSTSTTTATSANIQSNDTKISEQDCKSSVKEDKLKS